MIDIEEVIEELIAKHEIKEPFTATHRGVLKIGTLEIEVVVAEDGRRIITEDGLTAFLDWLQQPPTPDSINMRDGQIRGDPT